MKYAFMSFSCPQLPLQDMLALAVNSGYDGIEPRLGAGHLHGIEIGTSMAERAEIRGLAEKSGIRICCLATGVCLTDPEKQAEELVSARKAMELAKDIGCPLIRVFGGAYPDKVSRSEAITHLARAFRDLIPDAERTGVQICLETHDHWCHPEHVSEVLALVDHPTAGVNWDFQHPLRTCGWNVENSFRLLSPWILHVHFHDGTLEQSRLEMLPAGEGVYEVEKAVKLLQSIRYKGYLSGEWFDWPDYTEYLPREVSRMRKFEESSSNNPD
ncbi:MAG: hypothetical protein AMXMBFR75_28030 [Candidatus Hinthialibacteria bacterium]